MTTAVIGGLAVDLEASSARFVADMGKAAGAVSSNSAIMNRSLARLDRGFQSSLGHVARFARNMVSVRGVVATLAGGAGLGLLLRRSLDFADSIAKAANATGVSAGALQEYRFAAEQSGISTSQLDQALVVFVKRMGEAAAGTGPLVSGLKGLDGALLDQLRAARNQEQALDAVVRAMAAAGSAAERARIANAAFGRSGIQLVNIVQEGAQGFAALRAQARSLGLVLRDDLISQAVTAKDNLAVLGRVIGTSLTRAVLQLTPAIVELTQRLIDGLPTLVAWLDRLGQFVGLIDAGPAQKLAEINAEIERLRKLADAPFAVDIRQGGLLFTDEQFRAQIRELEEQRVALEAELEQRRMAIDEARKIAAGDTGTPLPVTVGAPPAAGPTARARPRAKPPTIDVLRPQEIARMKADADAAAKLRREQEALAASAANVFAATATPLERYRSELAALQVMLEQNQIGTLTYARAIEQAQERLDAATLATNRFAAAGVEMGRAVSNSLEDVLLNASSARDGLRGLIQEIQRLVLRAAVLDPLSDSLGGVLGKAFAGGGAGGGLFGSLGKLFGFQHGGAFNVPGVGGPDSQVVAFRATPGEPVAVGAAAGGTTVFNIDARGAAPGVEKRILDVLREVSGSVETRAVAAVRDARFRDPSLFRR